MYFFVPTAEKVGLFAAPQFAQVIVPVNPGAQKA